MNDDVGNFLKLFFGPPFLALDEIEDFFIDYLMAIAPDDERVRKFMDYVLENYIAADSDFLPDDKLVWIFSLTFQLIVPDACKNCWHIEQERRSDSVKKRSSNSRTDDATRFSWINRFDFLIRMFPISSSQHRWNSKQHFSFNDSPPNWFNSLWLAVYEAPLRRVGLTLPLHIFNHTDCYTLTVLNLFKCEGKCECTRIWDSTRIRLFSSVYYSYSATISSNFCPPTILWNIHN